MNIEEITRSLSKKYCIEACYGSKASLYGQAYRDKIIDKDTYNQAREFYGRLWNYAGD